MLILEAILNAHPLLPTTLNSTLPAELEQIINRCLEKDRNLRYQHAAEIITDLRWLKRDIESHNLVAVPKAATGARNRTAFWILGAVALVIVATIAGYFTWHRPAKLTERDTIVLDDFSNTTADPVFDDALKTALSVSLNQSPFLNVFSDNKVAVTLKLMTLPPDTKLTPDVGRELCQRAGSKAYIAGSIASLGSQYVLGLKVVNCQSGDTLAQEQVAVSAKEKVLDALGRVASKVRGELGESLATVQKFDVPLEQATTSSLEALKEFSLGHKAAREKTPSAALPYHQRAIQLDPNFAMGYWAVCNDYYSLGEPGQATEYFTKAFELREYASEREKLAITGDYYQNVTGELEKSAQTYREEIESYPRDYAPHLGLGNVYLGQGQYEKSADAYRRAFVCPRITLVHTSISPTVCSPCSDSTKRGRSSSRRRRESWMITYSTVSSMHWRF